MYVCIARIRKTPLTHCQRNANNRQTGGFSDSVETGLAQLLDWLYNFFIYDLRACFRCRGHCEPTEHIDNKEQTSAEQHVDPVDRSSDSKRTRCLVSRGAVSCRSVQRQLQFTIYHLLTISKAISTHVLSIVFSQF